MRMDMRSDGKAGHGPSAMDGIASPKSYFMRSLRLGT